jgi:hypothetical protein
MRGTLAGSVLAAAVVTPAPARADEVWLHLTATGTVQADAAAVHARDGAHFCSAAPDPWTAPGARDDRTAPFPFYRLVFGQASPADEPESPGPSIGLALSDYAPAVRNHSDPANDSIELVIAGRHFIGHSGLTDPGYHFAVTYRADRHGGGFVARHLHEAGTGAGIIDVAGSWRCPPVAAGLPEVTVRAHRLFAGAVPVHAEATQLRLTRSGAGWQVIDQTTGEAFIARVDLRPLHLARSIRRQAESGRAALLVDATVRPGDPPLVVARLLAGVEPCTEPPPVMDAAVVH